MLENIHSDEKNLDEKIEKKRAEYERNMKRLRTLKDVRPAFMDEYEALEKELEKLYEQYLVKFRIQSYLEQQLDEYNQSEQEKFEETARTMQMTIKKMKDQEKERNGNPFLDDDEMLISADSDQSDDQIDKKRGKNQVKNRQQLAQQQAGQQKQQQMKNFGKMNADISDDDSDEDEDEDEEESDEESDEDEDDDDDLQVAVHKTKMNESVKNAKPKVKVPKDESDSDFWDSRT